MWGDVELQEYLLGRRGEDPADPAGLPAEHHDHRADDAGAGRGQRDLGDRHQSDVSLQDLPRFEIYSVKQAQG